MTNQQLSEDSQRSSVQCQPSSDVSSTNLERLNWEGVISTTLYQMTAQHVPEQNQLYRYCTARTRLCTSSSRDTRTSYGEHGPMNTRRNPLALHSDPLARVGENRSKVRGRQGATACSSCGPHSYCEFIQHLDGSGSHLSIKQIIRLLRAALSENLTKTTAQAPVCVI